MLEGRIISVPAPGSMGGESAKNVKDAMIKVGKSVQQTDAGYQAVVTNGVTLNSGLNMKNELDKLQKAFPGTTFTVDNRVIKVETNAFGRASAEQLAAALQRIGKSVHGTKTVVTNGVTLNDGLNMKTELGKLRDDFPGTTFTVDNRVIKVETNNFGGTSAGQLAAALQGIGKSVQHARAGEYLHDQRSTIKPIMSTASGFLDVPGQAEGVAPQPPLPQRVVPRRCVCV